ncbi:MAG: cytochrome C, partial [Acidobacteria bacterium]|nr:cytochrome C [Acidobacteriota bacterium]
PTTCESCHSENAWQPANFNHNQTAFPLTGAHRTLDCQSCHAGGYSGTPTDCFSCHQDDYNGTNDPNHASVG